MDYVLGKGEVVSVATGGAESRLSVQSGRIWLTCSGDPADYLLSQEDRYTLAGEGTVVLEALTEATIAIERIAEPAARAFVRFELTISREAG